MWVFIKLNVNTGQNMAAIDNSYKKNKQAFAKIKEIISLSNIYFEPKSFQPKRARFSYINDIYSCIRNFMVLYKILLSSGYAVYSIFKEESPDFRCFNVSHIC